MCRASATPPLLARGRLAFVPRPQRQWNAYVMHTNPEKQRFLHTMSVLLAANVTPVPIRAVSTSSAWLLELFPECAARKMARSYRCSLASSCLTPALGWRKMGRGGAHAPGLSGEEPSRHLSQRAGWLLHDLRGRYMFAGRGTRPRREF